MLRSSLALLGALIAMTAFSLEGAAAATPNLTASVKRPKERRWLELGSEISYKASTDLADDRDPRNFNNMLTGSLTAGFLDPDDGSDLYNLNLEVTGLWQSQGNSIDTSQSIVEVSDVDVSAETTFSLGEAFHARHFAKLLAGISFPTSLESQYEGVKSAPYVAPMIISRFGPGKILTLVNGVNATYIANTFEFSPISKQINPDWSVAYDLRLSAKFFRKLTATVGASAKNTHHLDGSNLVSFSNFQALSLGLNDFSLGLRHVNGNHVLDRDVSLWHVDRYRRIVTFTMGYGF